ncbi:MAG: phosphatidylserine decarboxylase [Deltaproteobacteria bacterium RIFCSPLOWO2_02_FULL_50_16]|nr:MAG: phosphatidylserine decarboxylase [Deltaproteobacteria bacterium GWA2_50_8]OGQ26229.1 MAG: phosphatidylserine decarboxylase [Deltaproteobacteria bacterium RIFCSPHIGHO2_02_FULL_50_15]OGQ58390.1 MAG: phosphatidylserine decarboxylase [Deltaproteobacteria bacterium RIFCSPLOWO2_02_FULL_50_16]OGQ67542.1 MAG: phosphatidylserine decarboxylase [Deltaproteobacteria bacterium RIFCSPLOWO2_12_FULL_50_11]
MENDNKYIAVEGYPFIGIALVLTLLMVFLQWWIPFVIFLILTGFVVFFFRNPRRQGPADPNILVSPADGKVIAIEDIGDSHFLQGPTRRISIFLSIFNVHMNWIPFSGTILNIIYSPGKYFMAYHPKASTENEQNAVILEMEGGGQMAFVQIAGWVARRIVCYLKEGQGVLRGQLMGLIRFGSRVDIYLPPFADILVQPGMRVTGGETPLARLKK